MQNAADARQTQPDRTASRRNRPPQPRTFHHRSQVRFIAARRSYWLSQVLGEPTARQAALAESIASLEWMAAACRHENTLTSLRDLREHLRLRDRAVADLERTVKGAAEAEAPDSFDALRRYLARGPDQDESAEALA